MAVVTIVSAKQSVTFSPCRRQMRKSGALVVERVTGIEPAWPAWKAGALPLSYTRELLYLSRGKGSGNPKAHTGRSVLSPNLQLR